MLGNIDPLTISAVALGGGLLLKAVRKFAQSFKSIKEIRLEMKDTETTFVLKREESMATFSHTEESGSTAVLREQDVNPDLGKKVAHVPVPQPKAPRHKRRTKNVEKKLIGKKPQKL